MARKSPVPEFDYDLFSMNQKQKRFYKRWKDAWQQGEAIDLEGYTDYAKYYALRDLSKMPYLEQLSELLRLSEIYNTGDLYSWIYECYLHLEEYVKAYETLQTQLVIGSRQSYLVDRIWSLKLITGDQISGSELLSIFGPKLTDLALPYIEDIVQYLDTLIASYEEHKSLNLIDLWSASCHKYEELNLTWLSFSRCKQAEYFSTQVTRIAENQLRQSMGLPRVGEGWFAETELYYFVKSALPDYTVQHHASPPWLGRQHLDIYISDLRIGIEYQGLQHDEPVEFFGGQESFDETVNRDKRKKSLCEKHGVSLVYVRPGYEIRDVLEEIETLSKRRLFDNGYQLAINNVALEKHDDVTEILLGIDANAVPEVPLPPKDEFDLPSDLIYEPLVPDLDRQVSEEIANQHYRLSEQIEDAYRDRNNDSGALDRAITFCKQQIEIAEDMAHYFHQEPHKQLANCMQKAEEVKHDPRRYQFYLDMVDSYRRRTKNTNLPQHKGFQQLVIIYEKQKQHKEAVELALMAKAQGWAIKDYWNRKIAQLLRKLEKSGEKYW
jgi:hypothetical protein